MFTRGVRPALNVARAAKQQQAGMATLKEIDQRCVKVDSSARANTSDDRSAPRLSIMRARKRSQDVVLTPQPQVGQEH
jgi:hypothetical protein